MSEKQSSVPNDKKFQSLNEKLEKDENFKKLYNTRIAHLNCMYVRRIPNDICKEELLLSDYLFGQYGQIKQLTMTKGYYNPKNQKQPKHMNCHVIYENQTEATKAILAVNGLSIDGKELKASYGLTRYCCNFLQEVPCDNQNCQYLHQYQPEERSFQKRNKNDDLLF